MSYLWTHFILEAPIITNESEEEIPIKGGSKNSIGVMVLIKSDLMQYDIQESKLWKWVIMFFNKMKHYVGENIKFFELRPFSYAKGANDD